MSIQALWRDKVSRKGPRRRFPFQRRAFGDTVDGSILAGSETTLPATHDAVDTLLTLADRLVWQPETKAYGSRANLVAVGKLATYRAWYDPCDDKNPWSLTVICQRTQQPLGRDYPTLAALKAACRRHAFTGDWSDFLEADYEFRWTDGFGYGAFITARLWRGHYRIQRRRGRKSRTAYAYTYAPEYRHHYQPEGGELFEDNTAKPYQCPYRYKRLGEAKSACIYHFHIGEWRP